MTRHDLVGTDGTSRRVEAAWEYTAGGRIHRTWRGATSFAGGVERYEVTSYDDETLPTSVEVTDPFGLTATYSLEYDDDSVKPRLVSVSGQCPSCGGPDEQYEYDDPAHPLRPTARIDGNGHRTELTYNPNGTVASRIEAAATVDERVISFEYDLAFPGLLVREERPSTNGVGLRQASWVYHSTSGVLESMTVSGDEDTYDADGDGIAEGAFTLTTLYSGHNLAGHPGEIDPPGFGIGDLTAFTYDVPGRNGLLADTRSDPIVGATAFGYDGLNRRTAIVDPNGVETRTAYDPLDRVEEVVAAADTLDALTTDYRYDAFGELEAIVHPRGNVTVYGYDAAGRLEEVRRQAGENLAVGDERTFYSLNDFGQRVQEDQQVWDGSVWQSAMTTAYHYSSRCHLDAVVHDGAAVTEYAYDCDGNLTALWDANHPSASGTAAPTQVYAYDSLDRLTEVRQPWVAGIDCRGTTAPADCAVTFYDYDRQDHLIGVNDAEGNTTSYVYSDRDLLTGELSPASGATSHQYNDHGELVRTTDARGVSVARAVDALDRLTAVGYPAAAELDTVFAYDVAPAACGGASFPIGRLASIGRHGESVDYCYDAHGRPTRDGALIYAYDANGNRTRIGHPGGIEGVYTYDLADRPASLAVVTPHTPPQGTPVVTSATYLPSGPLTGLALGNGATETRSFDGRYFPATIALAAPTSRTWTYTTDAVGNVTEIHESRDCADLELTGETVSTTLTETACGRLLAGPDYTVAATGDLTLRASTQIVLRDGFSVATGGRLTAGIEPTLTDSTRTFAYRDTSYLLTDATGEWGSLSWTYDRIGNRLTETRDGNVDAYTYLTNGTCDPMLATCNTPLLEEISGPVFGSRSFTHGPAGHLEIVDRGANVVRFDPDDEGRTAEARRTDETDTTTFATSTFTYDGRSYLREATDPATGGTAEPIYSSEGLLNALTRRDSSSDPATTYHLFHFAGRPVAQVVSGATADTWWYLTTDHLGTPIVATDGAGAEVWAGPLEPFGRDPRAGLPAGALANGVFLRFPGQWEDETWQDVTMGAEMYYNVHRWYAPGIGSYTRPDPLGVVDQVFFSFTPAGGSQASLRHLYGYAVQNPLVLIDPLGLKARTCCKPIAGGLLSPFNHCYVEVIDDDTGERQTHGLHRIDGGIFGRGKGRYIPNARFDRQAPTGDCGPWDESCAIDDCVRQESQSYPSPSEYHYLGPNSNTFARTVTNSCGLTPPDIADTLRTPGWNSALPNR